MKMMKTVSLVLEFECMYYVWTRNCQVKRLSPILLAPIKLMCSNEIYYILKTIIAVVYTVIMTFVISLQLRFVTQDSLNIT